MVMQSGDRFLLKLGGLTIGSLRVIRMELTGQVIEANNVEAGAWRVLLSGSGIKSLSINAEGVFSDTAVEEDLQSYAFDQTARNYQLLFGNGDVLTGLFIVSSYQRNGQVSGEEGFSVVLESAGVVS